jgi:hypothetical protein
MCTLYESMALWHIRDFGIFSNPVTNSPRITHTHIYIYSTHIYSANAHIKPTKPLTELRIFPRQSFSYSSLQHKNNTIGSSESPNTNPRSWCSLLPIFTIPNLHSQIPSNQTLEHILNLSPSFQHPFWTKPCFSVLWITAVVSKLFSSSSFSFKIYR